jgi:hypothetical protein
VIRRAKPLKNRLVVRSTPARTSILRGKPKLEIFSLFGEAKPVQSTASPIAPSVLAPSLPPPLHFPQGMTEQQQFLFFTEFRRREKSPSTAALWNWIIGPWANRFYMRQPGLAVLFLVLQEVLVWSAILSLSAAPGAAIFLFAIWLIWWIADSCMAPDRAREYNRRLALEVAATVSYYMRPAPPPLPIRIEGDVRVMMPPPLNFGS